MAELIDSTFRTFRRWPQAADKERVVTHYLFAWPKLIDGVASVADVFGSRWPYNYSGSEEEADARALWCDWAVVGNDLRAAMRDFDARVKAASNGDASDGDGDAAADLPLAKSAA